MILTATHKELDVLKKNINSGIDLLPVDTKTPLSCFAKNGYYVVDKKIFRHKVYAMQEATRKRLKPPDIIWVFNNDVYDNVDWLTPSGSPLIEWYRKRALQLREKYDYLILAFSGGGDSTNVLDSFVLNNIHLDEVVSWWPRGQSSGRYTPSMDSDVKNFNSEWDYLVEPKLKWLQKIAPDVKISVCDNLDNMRPEEPKQDIVEITSHHCWTGIQRYRAIDDIFFQRQKKHKNCAIIMGVNPPCPVIIKRHFFTLFWDFATTPHYASDLVDQGLRNVEFFYWTPDMPELVKEQAHCLLNILKSNPQCATLVEKWSVNGVNGRQPLDKKTAELQRRWIKSILYPTYDPQALQVDKHDSPINRPDWFSWFYDNPHADEILQPHRSAITAHQNLIDPDFFVTRNNEIHRYHNYRSRLYYIGDWCND